MASNVPTTPDTLITIKVSFEGQYRKFKLPLRDLGASVLPSKLHNFLGIPPNVEVIYERYSDSAAYFVRLDPNDPAVYKQLYRAAKAKLKLRLRATIVKSSMEVPLSNGSSGIEQFGAQDVHGTNPGQATVSGNGIPATYPQVEVASREDISSSLSKDLSPTESQPAIPQPIVAQSVVQAAVQSAVPQPDASVLSNLSSPRHNLATVVGPVHGYSLSVGQLPGSSYAVYCNACDAPIANAHYHCGICADGDFDLCCDCVDNGHLCDREEHWLIKRFIENGMVINSTTERLAPQKKAPAMEASKSSMVQKETVEDNSEIDEEEDITARTCNCCVEVFPESAFVECTVCEDYDLCVQCLLDMKHGHNPGHGFKPATDDTLMDELAQALCAPGRNLRHYALCDGCDKTIVGIRHKCFDCPDWDYCSACVPSAPYIHPGHRFVQVVEPLKFKTSQEPRHIGKLCDGPLCNDKPNQRCIVGDRYKCTVCHDTDFCARCEASPINHHNKTHPLIKFKTPVRNVTVSTIHERPGGGEMPILGDLPTRTRQSTTAPPSPPVPSTNTASPVQTVVDVKPVNSGSVDLKQNQSNSTTGNSDVSSELNATFVADAVPDGTKLAPNRVFCQTWSIKNPGPSTWPKGCSIKFVGGDNMRNIDMAHPVSVADLERSVETNSCPLALEPGRLWSFTVTLKTPNREGKCISYWRLTAPNGVKFGHKLWCDIDVSRQMAQQSSIQPQAGKYPTPLPYAGSFYGNTSSVNKPQNLNVDGTATVMRNSVNSLLTQVNSSLQTTQALQERMMGTSSNMGNPTQDNVASSVANGAPPAYQATNASPSTAPPVAPLSNGPRSALSNYALQLMMLEQMNKKRLMLARAEHEAAGRELKETDTKRNMKVEDIVDVDSKLKLRTGQRSPYTDEPVDEKHESGPVSTGRAESSKTKDTKEDLSIPNEEPVTDNTAKKDDESEVSQSTMIFPKLEKESPVVHDSGDSEGQGVTGNAKSDGQEELISEVESLKLEDDGTEDEEGFLTDEEYDILDASDEEFLSVAQRGAQK